MLQYMPIYLVGPVWKWYTNKIIIILLLLLLLLLSLVMIL